MKSWTDAETLVAYADGQLTPEQAEGVEEALRQDDEARETLRRLREDSAALRAALAGVTNEPLPRRTVSLVESPSAEIVELPAGPIGGAGPGSRLWQSMLAASLAAAVVAGAVSFLVSSRQIEREVARLAAATAPGALARDKAISQALESLVSGTSLEWQNPDGIMVGSVTPVRSFRVASGQWCREYLLLDLLPGGSDRRRGVACREEDGHWTTRALLLEDS